MPDRSPIHRPVHRPVHRLVYCSRAALSGPRPVEAELERILAVSRRNNARDGLTGALLFTEGSFAQVLEGPLDAIERAFERIGRDPRHGAVTVLQFAKQAERCFPAWSMGHAVKIVDPRLARISLDRAFLDRTGAAGDEVLGLLQRALEREEDWAGVR